jgi:elongation factor G
MKALYYDASDQGKTFHVEPIPSELEDYARSYRDKLFDKLTEHDESDRLTTLVLEGKEVPAEAVRAAVREQTLKRLIQPVFAGSGREHIGVQPLMDAVTYYLPGPLDRPPVTGVNPKKKDKEEKRKCDPKEPFCGLVFKIVSDTHGELFYVRIYSGTLKANSRVLNPGRDSKELISKLFHTYADPTQRKELPEAYAGDIVAVLGMKEAITGDTLCETQHPILLERISFAEAVVSQSIEPESSADRDKMIDTLEKLRREDPTFTWKPDKDTGQTLMNGMGTLHLEIKRHRMQRDFRLRVRVGKPRVSYRETLRKPIRVEGECVRQAGGTGLFAKIVVEFEPFKGEESVTVVHRLKPDVLLPEFLTAAEQGIRGALESGELGFPVMNVKANVVGGEMDEQFSTDVAFLQAGADSVHKAMRENIVLLEPVMKLEVTVPEEYLGPITADLNARRADIRDVILRGKLRVVLAVVPMREMFDYADKVRSLSQGRASSTMEPCEYRPAPDEVLRKLTNPDGFL